MFDPSILPDLVRLGYDRSMDELRANKASQNPASGSVERMKFEVLSLDEAHRQVRLPPGMQLDLGGIAKGWIGEQAAKLLAETSTACAVNIGGDMFLNGTSAGQSRWEVELEDPLAPDQTLAVLAVKGRAVAMLVDISDPL